jgi:hypothetical protein
MPATITSVKGTGGNPPTSIEVTGTATACERVRVTSACSRDVAEVDVVNSGWGAVLQSTASGRLAESHSSGTRPFLPMW